MKQHDTSVEPQDDLPEPIQLTPEQVTEVAGGLTPAAAILRKGLPQVAS